MATPFVVPKITLPKDSKEFDQHCSQVNSNAGGIRPAGYATPAGSSCRLSCASWCTVCEHQISQSTNDYATSLRKKPPEMVQLNRCNTGNRIDDRLQRGCSPPASNNNTFNIASRVADFSTNFERQCNSVVSEVREGKNWLASCTNGVQGRYLREVEALRGKLRELRDSLPLQVTGVTESPTEKNTVGSTASLNSASECPPTNVPRTSTVVNHDKQDSQVRERKRGSTPDTQDSRTKQLDSCKVSNKNSGCALGAGSKRPRDGSPEVRQAFHSVPYKGKGFPSNRYTNKPFLNEASSSLSLESEENEDESIEEEQNESDDDYYVEDAGKIINRAQKSASVSPSYVVGDTFGKISLNDNQNYVHPPNPDIHPSIRPSLFSQVPPYVKFSNHEIKVEKPLPTALQRILKWKLTTITPVVVRKTIMNSGFKIVRRSPEWTGTWGKQMKSVCFKTLKNNQKLNHFPGTFQIGRKDRLWKNLYNLMTKFGKKEFGFIPRTYVLPQDNKALRAAWEKSSGKARWIIKPPASARGSGIKVIHKRTQIPKKVPLIVQKYISNPYLINGSKFDLRLYVLVTSFNPLRIYLYDNGLVRFASVKYSDDMNTLADRYMHLTNYSINKFSTQYTQNEDAEACQGHKWTVKTLWSYLEGSVNVDALWESLTELVIKTMIGGESPISQLTWANLPSRYCSYELFGVDVLLDENLKPWLLEVNISPSLHSASPLDLAVKGPMVQNIMNIAGYHIPNKLTASQQAETLQKLGLEASADLCYDSRLYVMGLSPEEKNKHNHFIHLDDRDMYLESILSDLTPDDVRHLIQYEDELTQIGKFEKIFPTPDTHYYQQFFDTPRYYNMLFDAWETKYHKDRSAGVQLLESLCRQKIHLDISNIESRKSLVCVNEVLLRSSDEGESEKGPVTLKTRACNTTTDDSTHKKQGDLLNGNVQKVMPAE